MPASAGGVGDCSRYGWKKEKHLHCMHSSARTQALQAPHTYYTIPAGSISGHSLIIQLVIHHVAPIVLFEACQGALQLCQMYLAVLVQLPRFPGSKRYARVTTSYNKMDPGSLCPPYRSLQTQESLTHPIERGFANQRTNMLVIRYLRLTLFLGRSARAKFVLQLHSSTSRSSHSYNRLK
jgi:hypothetical protein